jgi:hypothetical protein
MIKSILSKIYLSYAGAHFPKSQCADAFRSIEVLDDPRVPFMPITFPSDQILQPSIPQPTVHHLHCLIPLLLLQSLVVGVVEPITCQLDP